MNSKSEGDPQAVEPVLARRGRGRVGKEANFPIAPTRSELPDGYTELLSDLRARVEQERLRVVIAASSGMVQLYWDIGKRILEQQAK